MVRYLSVVVSLLLATLLSACSGSTGTNSSSGTTEVTVALQASATGKAVFYVMTSSTYLFQNYTSRSKIPDEVATFVITTSGADFDPIVVTRPKSATLFPVKLAVPNGKDRTITIEGKNSVNDVVYVGKSNIPLLDGTPVALPVSITFVAPLSKQYGGSKNDIPVSIALTKDDGYFAVAKTGSFGLYSSTNQTPKLLALKLRSNGSVMWQKVIGPDAAAGNLTSRPYLEGGGFQTSDGGYAFSGTHGLLTGAIYGLFFVKLDKNGGFTLQEQFNGPLSPAAGRQSGDSFVIQTLDGGYIISGSSNVFNLALATPVSLFDFWVLKLDKDGTVQWHTTIGGTGTNNQRSRIIQNPDGGYMMIGLADNDLNSRSVCMIKLDSTGNVTWSKYGYTPPVAIPSAGGTVSERPMLASADGGYVVAVNGVTSPGGSTSNGIWIFKTDTSGTVVWQNQYGKAIGASVRALLPSSDGGYMVNGSYSGGTLLFKLDSAGKVVWDKRPATTEFADAIMQPNNGGILSLSGKTSTAGDLDLWLLRSNTPTAAEIAIPSTLGVTATTVSPSNRTFVVTPRALNLLGQNTSPNLTMTPTFLVPN